MTTDSAPNWIATDDYLLSPRNPIANADQTWVKQAALRMLERDDVQTAIRQAKFLWATVSEKGSAEAKRKLPELMSLGQCVGRLACHNRWQRANATRLASARVAHFPDHPRGGMITHREFARIAQRRVGRGSSQSKRNSRPILAGREQVRRESDPE
jgi:hypothetical protein